MYTETILDLILARRAAASTLRPVRRAAISSTTA